MLKMTLRAAAAVGVIAVAAGLGGSGSPARAEMVYRLATMGEPKTLDPQLTSGTWEDYITGDAFLGLLTEAADAKAIPGAAESWTIKPSVFRSSGTWATRRRIASRGPRIVTG